MQIQISGVASLRDAIGLRMGVSTDIVPLWGQNLLHFNAPVVPNGTSTANAGIFVSRRQPIG